MFDLERGAFGGLARLPLTVAFVLASFAFCLDAQGQTAVGDSEETHVPVRTDSPRDTINSLLRLAGEMDVALGEYLESPSFEGISKIALLSDELNVLLDLSQVAESSRREVGIHTMTHLLDVLDRLEPLDPESFPDVDGIDPEGPGTYRVPQTSVFIQRQTEGERRNEYLFSAGTVQAAPRLFRALSSMPKRSSLPIESYSQASLQLVGPAIPSAVYGMIPDQLRRTALGSPIWKVAATLIVFGVVAWLLLMALRAIAAMKPTGRLSGLALKSLVPIALLFAVGIVLPAALFHINLSGRFADIATGTMIIAAHAAYGWLFWLAAGAVFEWIILSPHIADKSLDANLLRLVARVIGVVGVVVIVAFGGQAIGLPIMSVLAGLGIGGLAVALALRPTLENFVGGIMLYIDRPVSVGDFCKFGDQIGTVESIGVRSTQVRALDRTVVTVPNAQFADMQIVNYAHCDQMLLRDFLGLRFETSPDQLRHVLAAIRRMLHAHPRIDPNTVRVRFAGYGDSSLQVEVRVYVETREWNDFFAVREDVYLRIYDIVVDSGTGFAFPSQTVYLRRDDGLDQGRSRSAEEQVAAWRNRGQLPFPRLASAEVDRLRASLDYPPRGSVDHLSGEPKPDMGAERLSAAVQDASDNEGEDLPLANEREKSS